MFLFSFQELEKVTVPSGDDLAVRFHRFVSGELDRRFGQIENVMPLAMATLVNPRFLKSYLQNITSVARARSLIEDMLKKHIRSRALTAETSLAEQSRPEQNADQVKLSLSL